VQLSRQRVDYGDCFAPSVPQVSVAPASTPAPRSRTLGTIVDECLGIVRTPAETNATAEAPTSVAAEDGSYAGSGGPMSSGRETKPAAAPVSQGKATAAQIFAWIKKSVVEQTHLPEAAAELVSYWIISTWFQDVLHVLPCLVVTGPVHHAMLVLDCLHDYCLRPVRVAGFRRSDLGVLNSACGTWLSSEPNLDKRTAALLSSLTDRKCWVVEGGSFNGYAKPTAIYVGEHPGAHKILHSVQVHIAPTLQKAARRPEWLQKHIEHLPEHLKQYREAHLKTVHHSQFGAHGLPLEAAAIATALGRCIVNEPELLKRLILLLRGQISEDRYRTLDMTEAIVVEAALALSRGDRESVYVSEVAVEANRLLELRGEQIKLSPEKVGHQLRKLGLRSRRLSQAGNGLILDKATIAVIYQLAAVYLGEDLVANHENLPSSQPKENKQVEEVM
jgi:hypothetical protein